MPAKKCPHFAGILGSIIYRSDNGEYGVCFATFLYAGRIILLAFTSSSIRCALHPEILDIANIGV